MGQGDLPGLFYGRYYPNDQNGQDVDIYGPGWANQPWSYQKVVRSLIKLNAPDRP